MEKMLGAPGAASSKPPGMERMLGAPGAASSRPPGMERECREPAKPQLVSRIKNRLHPCNPVWTRLALATHPQFQSYSGF